MSKIKNIVVFGLTVIFPFLLSHAGNVENKKKFNIILSGNTNERCVLACETPELSLHFPQMAGNFKLGIIAGTQSRRASDFESIKVKKEKGKIIYTLKDKLLQKGIVIIRVASLSDSEGFVMEVESSGLPADIDLFWSFGGCYGKILPDKTQSHLEPAYCKYNVFSVEGNAFTVYYGESMKLKVVQGIVPPDSDIRLSDAHKQSTPLEFYNSGKKTDAPALTAVCKLNDNEKVYFCFYMQNKKADYNYFMLPELFAKEFNK